jgi:hypothetical protein
MHRSVTTIDIAEASESSSSGASKHSRPRPAVSQFRHLFTFGRNPLCRGDFLYHPLSGTMPYTVLAEYRWRMFIFEFVDVILRGLGQVCSSPSGACRSDVILRSSSSTIH